MLDKQQHMAYIDQKVFVMDAGMALVSSEDSFGEMLGQLRAEMASYGKVMKVSSSGGKFLDAVDPEDLPSALQDCDLFIDNSNFFRKRYLGIRLEDAREGRYAIRIKEAHKNSPMRDFLTLFVCAYGFLAILMGHGILFKVLGICCMLLGAYLFLYPSDKNTNAPKQIIQTLHRLYPEKN